jgi:transcriptional regulator with XRE-family HTH domain
VDDLAVGRAVRAVRVRKRLRQADVAEVAKVSRSTVSRIERGRVEALQVGTLRRVCGALDVRLLLEPRGEGGDLARLVAAGHSAMHETVARLFLELPEWITSPEVTFSEFGERGSIDILAWHAPTRSLLVIELKTELVDIQETVAVLDKKVRLAAKIAAKRGWHAATVSAWLLIADGTTNRRRVGAHRAMLRNAYPDDGRRVAAWLRRPAGRVSVLSFLSSAPGKNAGSSFAPVRRVPKARGSAPSTATRVPAGTT